MFLLASLLGSISTNSGIGLQHRSEAVQEEVHTISSPQSVRMSSVLETNSCEPWPLCDPSSVPMTQHAPKTFVATFHTSVNNSNHTSFQVYVNRTWSPHGADRFFNLVRLGFFDKTRFFRVLPGFVVEFGISGDPRLSAVYCNDLTCPGDAPGATIKPDPLLPSAPSNGQAGSVAYSLMDGGVNASTEIFINLANNSRLDAEGFVPFGILLNASDLQVVRALYSGYGELNESSICPGGHSAHGPCAGPKIQRMVEEGNAYLERNFPRMDYTRTARVLRSHREFKQPIRRHHALQHPVRAHRASQRPPRSLSPPQLHREVIRVSSIRELYALQVYHCSRS